jgi:hypothetical protein
MRPFQLGFITLFMAGLAFSACSTKDSGDQAESSGTSGMPQCENIYYIA